MYPKYFFTTGRYTFIKQLSDREFDWISFRDEFGEVEVVRGKIKTFTPKNITYMLRYEYHMQIPAETYDKLEKLYQQQAA
jgi:hypothetical protein